MNKATVPAGEPESPPQPMSLVVRVVELARWVVLLIVSFIGSQLIVSAVIFGLQAVNVPWQFDSVVSQLTYRLAVYAVMVAVIGGVVWYRYRKLTLGEAGLSRLPEWPDIGLSLAGVLVYALTTITVLTLASKIPGFNASQAQDIGLPHLYGGDLTAAFIVLVILTPLFEEAIFRGFLYGRLRGLQFPWWFSAVVVSLLFGLAHGQWNVGLDVFCLSMVACILREMTGSIWAGVLLHVVKNGFAFFVTFVFINGVNGL